MSMKVSVHCLVYNHEKYLRDTLNGFVGQKTDFDYEVFVHDDASTDNSKNIIEEYATKYPDIIKPIYQKENQYSKGVSIFSTFTLPKMSGEYIAVCEGDDCWTDPLKLKRQADFLDTHPDYVACVHNTIEENMRTKRKREMYNHLQDEDISFTDVIKGGSSGYHTSSLMYRIEYAYKEKPGFFAEAAKVGVGDYPLAIFLTLSGKVRFLCYSMSLYRVGTESSWTHKNVSDIHRCAFVFQCFANMLDEVNSYTHYEHDEMIRDLALEHRYKYMLLEKRYAELRKEPYKGFLDSKPFGYRMKMYMKQYFGGAYHCYRKIMYGNSRR